MTRCTSAALPSVVPKCSSLSASLHGGPVRQSYGGFGPHHLLFTIHFSPKTSTHFTTTIFLIST